MLYCKMVEKHTILWPGEWKSNLLNLSSSLLPYAKELSQATTKQESRQPQSVPARQVST